MGGSRLKLLYVSRAYTPHDWRFLDSFVRAGWVPVHVPLLADRLDARPLPSGAEREDALIGQREPDSMAEWRDRGARLAEVLDRIAPNAVIAGPLQSGTFLAALAHAKPLVAMSWGTDVLVDADATAFSQFATRYALDSSDAAFGDCRAVRDAIHRHSSIADDRIVTFPWGVDLHHFTPAASESSLRRDLGWANNQVFISTRNWEPLYAIDVLVRAFALVIQARPDARLLLLGDGSQAPVIRGRVGELGLDRVVHAPGRMPYDRLPDYFRLADAYVSSALSDGTSVSLLEAMACGLPVVVANSFGNREWVQDGVNGVMVQPGDAESLAAGMLSVPTTGDEAVRMRLANIATARNRADWDENFPALVRLAESLALSE